MGCDPDLPEEHYQQMDRDAEARRIRKRVLEKSDPPIRPSMLTMAQMELWVQTFIAPSQFSRGIRQEDLEKLQALERALFDDNGHGDGEHVA